MSPKEREIAVRAGAAMAELLLAGIEEDRETPEVTATAALLEVIRDWEPRNIYCLRDIAASIAKGEVWTMITGPDV